MQRRMIMIWAMLSYVLVPVVMTAGQDGTTRLFQIDRSKNANVVCYDVRLDGAGSLQKDPLDIYWMLNATDGSRESLGVFERAHAYGADVVTAYGRDSVDVRLQAVDKPIRITRRNGRWVALMTINGTSAVLERVYVNTTEGILPRVNWIRVTGTSESTGTRITETIAG